MAAVPDPGQEQAREVFDQLYQQHQRAILAYTRRRLSDVADAEEAAAETFVIAWRRIGTRPAEPLPWLYAIARRVVANQRRAGDRRARLLDRLHAQPQDVATPSVTDVGGPVLDALRRLRPDDQELLRLVAWEGLDHAQIAVVLGVSVNAVAIRLHRARARFTQALEPRMVKEFGASRTSDMVKGRMFGRERQEDTE